MKTDWTKPKDAVEPASPFHLLYMRLSGLAEKFLAEAQPFVLGDVADNERYATGLGMIGSLTNHCAQATAWLEETRREYPKVYEVFQRAWEKESAE